MILSHFPVVADHSAAYVPISNSTITAVTVTGFAILCNVLRLIPSLEYSQYVVPLASLILTYLCVVELYVADARFVFTVATFLNA